MNARKDELVRHFGRPVRVVPRYHKETLIDPFQTNNTDEPMRLHRAESMNDKFVALLSRPSSDSPSYLKESLKDIFSTTTSDESTVKLVQESEESSDSSVNSHEVSEGESNLSYQVSIELSQHDPRGGGLPTDYTDLPKYIEVVSYREIVKKRLDAIEAGFASLVQHHPAQDHPPHRPGYIHLSDDSCSMSETSHLSSMRTVKADNSKSVSMRTIRADYK